MGFLLLELQAGCVTTAPSRPNPSVAPPLPTPAPLAPGQPFTPGQPSVPGPTGTPPAPPPGGNPNIPLPPGASIAPPAVPGGSPQAFVPTSAEQARVQGVSARLYHANPWVKIKPQWLVRPGDVPGIANQGDQYVLISDGLVRNASDGQLAAVMSLHLADMAAGRQRMIMETERAQRMAQPRPPYFPGNTTLSAELAYLDQAEAAKRQSDPRDPRRREHQEQLVDPPTYARQVLTQAGFAAQELDAVGPLLQQFPAVRSPGR